MSKRWIEKLACCFLGLTGVLLVAGVLGVVFLALEAESAALVVGVVGLLVGVCWVIVLASLVVLLAWQVTGGGDPDEAGGGDAR
ncbi:MAG: hypothetical protein D6725_15080 [Planctomycetota bacterium]|nr:MAG: hypothetical protein D6725_15080 [Planctomycetota bacterium]